MFQLYCSPLIQILLGVEWGGSCNFPTDGSKFPTVKNLGLKLLMTFTMNSHTAHVENNVKFHSCSTKKFHVKMHSDTHDFTLLSPARFSQFEGEHSHPTDAFSKQISQQEQIYERLKSIHNAIGYIAMEWYSTPQFSRERWNQCAQLSTQKTDDQNRLFSLKWTAFMSTCISANRVVNFPEI